MIAIKMEYDDIAKFLIEHGAEKQFISNNMI